MNWIGPRGERGLVVAEERPGPGLGHRPVDGEHQRRRVAGDRRGDAALDAHAEDAAVAVDDGDDRVAAGGRGRRPVEQQSHLVGGQDRCCRRQRPPVDRRTRFDRSGSARRNPPAPRCDAGAAGLAVEPVRRRTAGEQVVPAAAEQVRPPSPAASLSVPGPPCIASVRRRPRRHSDRPRRRSTAGLSNVRGDLDPVVPGPGQDDPVR